LLDERRHTASSGRHHALDPAPQGRGGRGGAPGAIPLVAAMRRWGISETNTASGSGFTIATARPGCARRGEDK
jgi:hypothetical protein